MCKISKKQNFRTCRRTLRWVSAFRLPRWFGLTWPATHTAPLSMRDEKKHRMTVKGIETLAGREESSTMSADVIPNIDSMPPAAVAPAAILPLAEAVDINGVAALLSISKSSAKALASEGRLPAPALSVGKIRRWWKSEILAWLMNQCPTRARWVGIRESSIRRYLSARSAA